MARTHDLFDESMTGYKFHCYKMFVDDKQQKYQGNRLTKERDVSSKGPSLGITTLLIPEEWPSFETSNSILSPR